MGLQAITRYATSCGPGGFCNNAKLSTAGAVALEGCGVCTPRVSQDQLGGNDPREVAKGSVFDFFISYKQKDSAVFVTKLSAALSASMPRCGLIKLI